MLYEKRKMIRKRIVKGVIEANYVMGGKEESIRRPGKDGEEDKKVNSKISGDKKKLKDER